MEGGDGKQQELRLDEAVSTGVSFCFIDSQGEAVERLLNVIPENRKGDVIYLNPADMANQVSLNIFDITPDSPDRAMTEDYIIVNVIDILYDLYDPEHVGIISPRLENMMRNIMRLIMASPDDGTFLDIPKVFTDPGFIDSRVSYLKNQHAIEFWTVEWPKIKDSEPVGDMKSWIISKWAIFDMPVMKNTIGKVKSTIDFREIMNDGKILLANLSEGALGVLGSHLLKMMIVTGFQLAAMSRADMSEGDRTDFYLFINSSGSFVSHDFEPLLAEMRRYKLHLVMVNSSN
jgi:hypothetical protein